LGCGLIAAVGAFQYMNGTPTAVAATEKILVAAKEINISEAVAADSVQLVDWPTDRLPQGVLNDPQQLENLIARTRLFPGEPILRTKLMTPEEAGELKVPAGFRVVSVKVTQDTSVSNLLKPGDRVDVVGTFRPGSGLTTESITKTILKAVRVFAVNTVTTRGTESKEPVEARTVSLLLKPEQGEKVIMAESLGQIKLTLRSLDDVGVEETAGCSFDKLIGRSEVADESLTKSSPKPPPTAHSAAPVQWAMHVSSPQQAYEFRWTAGGTTPERIDLNAPPAKTDSKAAEEDAEESAPEPPAKQKQRTS
jgi:pilus assembly protein CpaB